MLLFAQGFKYGILLVLFLKSAGKLHGPLLLVEKSVAFSHLFLETVPHLEELLPAP